MGQLAMLFLFCVCAQADVATVVDVRPPIEIEHLVD